MTLAETIQACAKERLSEKKYRHTLSVGDEAAKLARRYGADPEKAYLAGLLHDLTKEEPYERQLALCRDYGIVLTQDEQEMPKILHAMTGAGFARRELGITDEALLGAVYYHTTAKADMTLLEKIIYLADYVEPLRSFDGVEAVRGRVYDDMDGALLIALSATMGEILERGGLLCLETVQARNFLLHTAAAPRDRKEHKPL